MMRARAAIAVLVGGVIGVGAPAVAPAHAAGASSSAKHCPRHCPKPKPKPKPTTGARGKRRQAPTDAVAAVPKALADAFALFSSPPEASIPGTVARTATAGAFRSWGLAPALTRRVSVGPDVFYVMPGREGLCLIIADVGSTCGQTDRVVANGISVSLVPQTLQPVDPAKGGSGTGPGTVRRLGLAPNGVTGITAVTASGRLVTARQSGNAFVIRTEDESTVGAAIGVGPNGQPFYLS
jgi:hypothetical protein